MKPGFYSDGTPCRDNLIQINEYFKGREFKHRRFGRAVIYGYCEFIKGQGNMYAIVYDRCPGIVLLTMEEFCKEVKTKIDSVNTKKFVQFFMRCLADGPKNYERDKAAHMRTLELQENNTDA